MRLIELLLFCFIISTASTYSRFGNQDGVQSEQLMLSTVPRTLENRMQYGRFKTGETDILARFLARI